MAVFPHWIFGMDLGRIRLHTVTLTYYELSESFHVAPSMISVGVTVVLMFRPLGAAIFGIAADRFGRKWPFVVNNILLIVFELATGICKTYRQFLAVRALFGIAMGGIYGNAAATALEDCPPAAQGLMSRIYQGGCAFGYFLATVFWKALDDGSECGWTKLFCFGAWPPALLIVFRLCLPETRTFNERNAFRNDGGTIHGVWVEANITFRRHWLLLLYLVLLMTRFTYMSHGTQDIIALMLKEKYNYSSTEITRVLVVGNIGAFIGSNVIGFSSQNFGRRLSIITMCLIGAALIYPYTATSGRGIYAAVFFEQFCVMGAWGIIPIHLMELSPTTFRTFVVGTSYQLGNLVLSASNTIETKLGERYPLPNVRSDGSTTEIYDYSIVMRIFTICVFVYIITITLLGPEKLGRTMGDDGEVHFDNDVELRPVVSLLNRQTVDSIASCRIFSSRAM